MMAEFGMSCDCIPSGSIQCGRVGREKPLEDMNNSIVGGSCNVMILFFLLSCYIKFRCTDLRSVLIFGVFLSKEMDLSLME